MNCDAGNDGRGTVFSITPSGKETVLYRFKGYPDDGAKPAAGLAEINGTLYGTTVFGGSGECGRGGVGYIGCGTVFAITTSGSETLLYSFASSSKYDGNFPNFEYRRHPDESRQHTATRCLRRRQYESLSALCRWREKHAGERRAGHNRCRRQRRMRISL